MQYLQCNGIFAGWLQWDWMFFNAKYPLGKLWQEQTH
jgi:hypothetical protein